MPQVWLARPRRYSMSSLSGKSARSMLACVSLSLQSRPSRRGLECMMTRSQVGHCRPSRTAYRVRRLVYGIPLYFAIESEDTKGKDCIWGDSVRVEIAIKDILPLSQSNVDNSEREVMRSLTTLRTSLSTIDIDIDTRFFTTQQPRVLIECRCRPVEMSCKDIHELLDTRWANEHQETPGRTFISCYQCPEPPACMLQPDSSGRC
jgi:hypothetical protein